MLNRLRTLLSHKANWVFALTLCIGLAASSVLYNTLIRIEQERLDLVVHEQALSVATSFESALHRRLVQVGSVAHFFASSEWVEFREFERFVNMVYDHDTPEDRVVTWLIRSTPADAPELIAKMRRNDDQLYHDFSIFDFDYTPHEPIPLNRNQPDLLVIGYTVPPRNQAHFIGRNIGKSRTVYQYSQFALARQKPYVSTIAAPIPAISDWHFFIVYPIKQRTANAQEEITGFLVSGNKLTSVLQDLKRLARSDLFRYQLTDEDHNVYSYPSNELHPKAPAFNAALRHRFELSGSPFELALEPITPKRAQDNPLFIVLALSSALVSLLIAFIMRSSLLKSQALAQQVQAQTATLASQNQALAKAVKNAEQAAEAKSDFLATMSHEIRTPMNAIMGMTNLLKRSNLDERQQHLISRVSLSTSHLMSIINDILDFSKIDAGALTLEETEFALSEITEQLVATLKDQCDEKNIAFTINVAQSCPASFRGDPLRVSQILLNLSANAVKFTEQGGVSISLTSYPCNAPGRIQLIARVKDTGIGIDPEKIPQLFDVFTQADSSTTRRFGGTGLGLSISRKLCQQMNGDITAASTPGLGSEFIATMELAAAKDSTPYAQRNDYNAAHRGSAIDNKPVPASRQPYSHIARSEPAAPADTSEHASPCILAVEDNATNREVLGFLLEDFGKPFAFAHDGKQALDYLKSHPDIAIVLMDCQMPVMDGFSATEKIRKGVAGEHYRDLPIVACTANASDSDRKACQQAGMNAFIAKPIDEVVLFDLLAHYLRQRKTPGK